MDGAVPDVQNTFIHLFVGTHIDERPINVGIGIVGWGNNCQYRDIVIHTNYKWVAYRRIVPIGAVDPPFIFTILHLHLKYSKGVVPHRGVGLVQ